MQLTLSIKRISAFAVAIILILAGIDSRAQSWVNVDQTGTRAFDADSIRTYNSLSSGYTYRSRTRRADSPSNFDYRRMVVNCAYAPRRHPNIEFPRPEVVIKPFLPARSWFVQPRGNSVVEDTQLARVEVDIVCEIVERKVPPIAEFTLGPETGDSFEVAPIQPPKAEPILGDGKKQPIPERQQRSLSSGSGFIVAPKIAITNEHVVRGCEEVVVRLDRRSIKAHVAISSKASDLAILELSEAMGLPASIRANALLGEDIVISGHPLAGLLSSDLIVATGQVNSLAGLGNDPWLMQISAPVQAGNSGGPVIDRSGAVVGVVVSKLNVERASKATGDIPQNVNFAIKPEILKLFLDSNRVPILISGIGKRLDGIEIAERARRFTVQVLCEKTP